MNWKVAGLGGVAVVAFMASIYWIGDLGPATNPTNAMAGFFLFQSHCSIPPVESGEPVAPQASARATVKSRATEVRPTTAMVGQTAVVSCKAPQATTVVVIVNR